MASSNLATDNHPRPAGPKHFVPPSLLRVRRFLFEHGMPIVPWAPAGEVLDQFYGLMHSRSGDDRFWQGIRELLEALQCDLQERLESEAQDNEILTYATHSRLLDEIRNGLQACESSAGGFLALARQLSPKSLAVLLLLGCAATVGCGARADNSSHTAASSGGSGGGSGTGGTTSLSTAGQPVSLHGYAPCVGGFVDAGALASVRDVALDCTARGPAQDAILACIATLNQSWSEGLQALLNCTTCDEASQYMTNLIQMCSSLPAQYDMCMMICCDCSSIYNGVRMV